MGRAMIHLMQKKDIFVMHHSLLLIARCSRPNLPELENQTGYSRGLYPVGSNDSITTCG